MSAMAASTSTKPDIDLLSPAFYGDIDAMHDAFTWLRHNDPLHRDESSGFVGVTKHADILEVEHRDEVRSEEHTSELQSLMRISYAVFCLKKTRKTQKCTTNKIKMPKLAQAKYN